MAIDYYGLFPCKVREAVSSADLLKMEKARNRAQAVLDLMRKDPQLGRSQPESEWSFSIVVAGPNGREEKQVRVADLLNEAAPLEALAGNCVNCPANVRLADFGCGGAIHYPISAQSERWLLSRLPDDLNSPPGQFLTRALSDFSYDGRSIDASRSRAELYEAGAPFERKWGGFFSKKTTITSSQMLHMAFGVGSLQPAHAKIVAYILGFLNNDFSVTNNPANQPQLNDDDRTKELKLFLSAAALAGANGVSVFIDA